MTYQQIAASVRRGGVITRTAIRAALRSAGLPAGATAIASVAREVARQLGIIRDAVTAARRGVATRRQWSLYWRSLRLPEPPRTTVRDRLDALRVEAVTDAVLGWWDLSQATVHVSYGSQALSVRRQAVGRYGRSAWTRYAWVIDITVPQDWRLRVRGLDPARGRDLLLDVAGGGDVRRAVIARRRGRSQVEVIPCYIAVRGRRWEAAPSEEEARAIVARWARWDEVWHASPDELEAYGYVRVRQLDALRAGACRSGIEDFRRRYLGGGRIVTVRDLIPYIHHTPVVKRTVALAILRECHH